MVVNWVKRQDAEVITQSLSPIFNWLQQTASSGLSQRAVLTHVSADVQQKQQQQQQKQQGKKTEKNKQTTTKNKTAV